MNRSIILLSSSMAWIINFGFPYKYNTFSELWIFLHILSALTHSQARKSHTQISFHFCPIQIDTQLVFRLVGHRVTRYIWSFLHFVVQSFGTQHIQSMKNKGFKVAQSGFIELINFSFFLLDHLLICFSLPMASRIY